MMAKNTARGTQTGLSSLKVLDPSMIVRGKCICIAAYMKIPYKLDSLMCQNHKLATLPQRSQMKFTSLNT